MQIIRNRIERLENRALEGAALDLTLLTDQELDARIAEAGTGTLWDMTLLTDAELLALEACFTDAGELMPERVTPEVEAALRRVER